MSFYETYDGAFLAIACLRSAVREYERELKEQDNFYLGLSEKRFYCKFLICIVFELARFRHFKCFLSFFPELLLKEKLEEKVFRRFNEIIFYIEEFYRRREKAREHRKGGK